MLPRAGAWKWISSLVVVAVGAAIAIPVYRYADADDAPGGMVIAVLIFIVATVFAAWVVREREAAADRK
jgi:Zn-dependent protease with chaperone function